MDQIYVIKQSGEKELFSQDKVLASMQRVGVPEALWPRAVEHIKKNLHQDIKTNEIFSHILEYLKDKDRNASVKFNLKQAIFQLGPTGFPFERFMERVFQNMGYKTQVDLILEGECVNHEVDIFLEKDGKKGIVEAKFHNQQGVKTDIHVALYTYARFLDLKEKNNISEIWLVTNTKLTEEAITYSKCKNMDIIAWNYPQGASLQDLVGNPKMYPITILNELSEQEKQLFIENNIIFCDQLLNKEKFNFNGNFIIKEEKLNRIKNSVNMILNGNGEKVSASHDEFFKNLN
ncbi:MAG: hypothetical protein A2857_00910 [Candidatus Levybacteria bacterium RIFCSPHIGHO2_01_FULL_36_15]|nr:MAG: hypothetical protein A2857_00910 [Candidatus Levybacteria bacterium RIFCSPHIGHO2_01_FULL_36_15]OGH37285.1 MAG: hypothetical protein A2905_01110 [Candidatus Levybacteria bacterium RIFCSPLOWO2_01_FULL_36_10]